MGGIRREIGVGHGVGEDDGDFGVWAIRGIRVLDWEGLLDGPDGPTRKRIHPAGN